jgi:hypothetical protein
VVFETSSLNTTHFLVELGRDVMVDEIIVLPIKEELESMLDEMIWEGTIHEGVVSFQHFLSEDSSIIVTYIVVRVCHQLQELHRSAVLHLRALDFIQLRRT